jgi:hypothetical protein
MAHCHIAEHYESGLMFSFNVSPRPDVFLRLVVPAANSAVGRAEG